MARPQEREVETAQRRAVPAGALRDADGRAGGRGGLDRGRCAVGGQERGCDERGEGHGQREDVVQKAAQHPGGRGGVGADPWGSRQDGGKTTRAHGECSFWPEDPRPARG